LDLRAIAEPPAILRRRMRNAICVGRGWAIDGTRFERFLGAGWSPRGAVVADLHRGDARLRVIATHLGLRPDERLGQARRLLELAEVAEGSVVIGGDLNVGPDRDAAGLLAGRLVDVWGARPNGLTYPADSPSARIDYVFVTDAISVQGSQVASTDASDHLALLTELELPD
jgi:endonuclease/exonuclease/phosphatase family metal-dependent hydrolase